MLCVYNAGFRGKAQLNESAETLACILASHLCISGPSHGGVVKAINAAKRCVIVKSAQAGLSLPHKDGSLYQEYATLVASIDVAIYMQPTILSSPSS